MGRALTFGGPVAPAMTASSIPQNLGVPPVIRDREQSQHARNRDNISFSLYAGVLSLNALRHVVSRALYRPCDLPAPFLICLHISQLEWYRTPRRHATSTELGVNLKPLLGSFARPWKMLQPVKQPPLPLACIPAEIGCLAAVLLPTCLWPQQNIQLNCTQAGMPVLVFSLRSAAAESLDGTSRGPRALCCRAAAHQSARSAIEWLLAGLPITTLCSIRRRKAGAISSTSHQRRSALVRHRRPILLPW